MAYFGHIGKEGQVESNRNRGRWSDVRRIDRALEDHDSQPLRRRHLMNEGNVFLGRDYFL